MGDHYQLPPTIKSYRAAQQVCPSTNRICLFAMCVCRTNSLFRNHLWPDRLCATTTAFHT